MTPEQLLQLQNTPTTTAPVVGMQAILNKENTETPLHTHDYGQLVFASKGQATCQSPNALWLVSAGQCFWVPAHVPHRVHTSGNAHLHYLLLCTDKHSLPEHACTLHISDLVRALIINLSTAPVSYAMDSPTGRKAVVLLEELTQQPVLPFHLPMSDNWRLQKIAIALSQQPAQRRTMREWAHYVALSERSLARLLRNETGLTFGEWRQQIQLMHAIYLLGLGKTVEHTAQAVGYASVTAFITMFKRKLGNPPGVYAATLNP